MCRKLWHKLNYGKDIDLKHYLALLSLCFCKITPPGLIRRNSSRYIAIGFGRRLITVLPLNQHDQGMEDVMHRLKLRNNQ